MNFSTSPPTSAKRLIAAAPLFLSVLFLTLSFVFLTCSQLANFRKNTLLFVYFGIVPSTYCVLTDLVLRGFFLNLSKAGVLCDTAKFNVKFQCSRVFRYFVGVKLKTNSHGYMAKICTILGEN